MLGNAETPSRSALLHEIDKVSFAVNDLTLYLDTHPDCQEGLARFQKEAASSPSGPPNWLIISWAVFGQTVLMLTGNWRRFS